MLETEGIDHVALTVRDLTTSVDWYQRVLGLERRHEIWEVPVMLGAGTTAVALFPARAPAGAGEASPLGFRHLAFRVSSANFQSAQSLLSEHGIAFEFQDHTIAHSIYFADPDGNQIEITTYDLGT